METLKDLLDVNGRQLLGKEAVSSEDLGKRSAVHKLEHEIQMVCGDKKINVSDNVFVLAILEEIDLFLQIETNNTKDEEEKKTRVRENE